MRFKSRLTACCIWRGSTVGKGRRNPAPLWQGRPTMDARSRKTLKSMRHLRLLPDASIALPPTALVYVAWRKIFDGNMRETVVSRSMDGGMTFSSPVVVGNDRWVYQACPHRPASLGVDRQGRLYVVWYTEGADETPAIYLAYSDDQGKTFSEKNNSIARRAPSPTIRRWRSIRKGGSS